MNHTNRKVESDVRAAKPPFWPLLTVACFLSFAAFASSSRALPDDLATLWKVNDADPLASIPTVEQRNANPMEFAYWLQDMVARAEGAYRTKNWKDTVKYYSALAAAVPENAIAHSRLCHTYGLLGEVELAIESCAAAMTRAGAKVFDQVRYVDAMLQEPTLAAADVDAIDQSLAHLREHARLHPQALPGEQAYRLAQDKVAIPAAAELSAEERVRNPQKWMKLRAEEIIKKQSGEPESEPQGDIHLPTQIEILNCRLGVRIGDAARLGQCTQRLRDYKFPETLLLPFAWAHAVQERDEARAEALIAKAESLGVSEHALSSMQQEQDKAFGNQWSKALSQSWIVPTIVCTLLALVAFYLLQRQRLGRASTQS